MSEMEIGKFLERMERQANIANEAREIPNSANEIQYPDEFNNCVPVITAESLMMAKLPTIIIATQSPGYTEELFKHDVEKTLVYFGLDAAMMMTIFLKHVPQNVHVLDSADAAEKMKRVVGLMNGATVVRCEEVRANAQLPTGHTLYEQARSTVTTQSSYTLRIVSLGVKTSSFMFEAMEYMLNHWDVPNKHVQFVTNGETDEEGFMHFWTSACVNKLCQSVQFVNVSRYLSFGYYKKGECRKLQKTSSD